MALNSSETILIGLTDTLQLMSFALKNNKGKSEFQVFSHSFHNGSITGVDVCQRKPLVATCGIDRSIKIWNYLTLELELSKEFEETVYSVALHPTGTKCSFILLPQTRLKKALEALKEIVYDAVTARLDKNKARLAFPSQG